jgi:hypothetical protein
MVKSIVRPAMVIAVAVGLAGCGTEHRLPIEPADPVAAVITAEVMADVAGTVADADERLLTTLDDASYRAELSTVLEELNHHIALRDVASAEAALGRARLLTERATVSVETEDFAADLGAIGLILDQSEVVLDAAAGRTQ